MRIRMLAAAAAFFMLSAHATEPPEGTTVLVAPINDAGAVQPPRVIRLPVQAGKVSKIIATKLLANSKSWIAKGHKYYSLCMPSGGEVACAPLVATSTMKDIEVSAYVGDSGEPKLTFRIAPATTQEPKRLIAAINYFLARTAKQVEHFGQKAANSARAKTAFSGLVAPSDFSEYCCYYIGGSDGGIDGEGYDADSYDWGSDYFGDEDTWDDPGISDLPTYPPGDDNGDADPCTDAGGNNICQQVVITGERPEFEYPIKMALPTCAVSPWAVTCTKPPPPVVGGDPMDQLPRGPTPWLPQSACNVWGALCSAGQIPAEQQPPPTTPEGQRARAERICVEKANRVMTYCHAMRDIEGEARFQTCRREALDMFRECSIISRNSGGERGK